MPTCAFCGFVWIAGYLVIWEFTRDIPATINSVL